jgi:hypothetical protein
VAVTLLVAAATTVRRPCLPVSSTVIITGNGTECRVVLILLFGAFAVLCYFVPSVIALVRGVPNAALVVVLNLLLGWTFVGWVVALVLACATVQPQPVLVVNAPPWGHPPMPPQGWAPPPWAPPQPAPPPWPPRALPPAGGDTAPQWLDQWPDPHRFDEQPPRY